MEEPLKEKVGTDLPEKEPLETCIPAVNLCGAVAIEEVRSLLKEWIQSSEGNLLLMTPSTSINLEHYKPNLIQASN